MKKIQKGIKELGENIKKTEIFIKKEENRIKKMREFEGVDIKKKQERRKRENRTTKKKEEIMIFLQIVGDERTRIWSGKIETKIWEVVEEIYKISLEK